MNTGMPDTKDVILNLKKVKKEKNLSLDKIVEMIEENNEFVSKTTLSRVFRKGSEDEIFRYEATLKPIANALLDIDNIETSDDTDTQAYKSLLKLKAEIISQLEDKIKVIESEEKRKYHDKLERETDKFQESLDFVKKQVELKDKRIDMLMAANERLSIMNNRMLEQFMECPLKNKDCKKD
jgi:transcriptional regulator with XRE-family HTH domain